MFYNTRHKHEVLFPSTHAKLRRTLWCLWIGKILVSVTRDSGQIYELPASRTVVFPSVFTTRMTFFFVKKRRYVLQTYVFAPQNVIGLGMFALFFTVLVNTTARTARWWRFVPLTARLPKRANRQMLWPARTWLLTTLKPAHLHTSSPFAPTLSLHSPLLSSDPK